MCREFCLLWVMMMFFANLYGLDSKDEEIREHIIADYSTLQQAEDTTTSQPHYDEELHRHLKSFNASQREEDTLGLAGEHKKYEQMSDFTDHISKPSILYERMRRSYYP
ncbi:hypothetical protein [uncultured Helicobacter sp.]|uniref:hypothetical protein n=1 Tax=uncultured Helicobacter sp. TaxID=175537 RepID=UPI001C3A5E25|nr:hypothetical protein [Candidatus Helicobacter avicola]